MSSNTMINKKRSRSISKDSFKSFKSNNSNKSNISNISKKQKIDKDYLLYDKTTAIDFHNKVTCQFCNRDITRSIRIFCNQCDELVYCIDCLILNKSNSTQTNTLKVTSHDHDYNIADNLNFNIINKEWTAQEELILLNCIEKYGLDNWTDISEFMGSKSKLECEAHYYSFYYKNKNEFLPKFNDKFLIKFNQKLEENSEIEKNQIKIRSQNVGKIPEFFSNKDNKNNRSRSLVKNRNKKDQTAITSASEILGYWPKREEFDIEYLNDAELEIAELEFLDDDTTEERDLKMNVLKVYNAQLDEREKRKKFVIERNLLDIKKQMNYERKLSKDDREIYNCLKPFARFMDNSEFYEMFEGIVLEKNLRQRLNQLKLYKKQGIKTYEEIEKYLEVESRNKKDDNKKSQMIFESCGLGGRINRYLKLGAEENVELDSNEREKNFIKNLAIPKSLYYDIKKRFNKELLDEKDTKNFVNKIISDKYNIDKDDAERIVDFIVKLNN